MPNQLVSHYRSSYPKESQGISDDDITMLFASRAGEYAANGIDIFKEYPDFNEDYSRIKNSQVSDRITIGDRAKQAAGSVLGGFIEGVGGTVAKAPAIIAKKMTGGLIDPTDEIQSGIDKAVSLVTPDFGGDEEKKSAIEGEFLTTKVPNAIGSTGSFMVTGGAIGRVAKVAGASIEGAGTLGTALSGAAGSFSDAYDEALKKSGSEEQAFQAAFLNFGVGLSEAVPLGKMLGKISRVSPTGTRALLSRLAKTPLGHASGEVATETIEEALQEAFQSGAGDVIARDIAQYDPNREMFKDTAESAAVGGASGFLLSLLSNSIHGAARKAAGKGEGKTAPGPLPANETVKVTPTQEQDPESVDVSKDVYDIDAKGLNDLLQKELEQGSDAVAGEKASLSPDAFRLYSIKLVEALKERESQRQQVATVETPAAPDDVAPKVEAPAPSPVESVAPKESTETPPPPAETPVSAEAPSPTPVEPVPETPAPQTPSVESTNEPPKSIGESVDRFMVDNTGEDSVEFVKGELDRIDRSVTELDQVTKTLSEITDRLADRKGSKEILTPEDIATLGSLDSEDLSPLKIHALIAKAKAGKATVSDITRTARLASNIYNRVNNRKAKIASRAGSLAEGGKLSFDALVNPESISYHRNEYSQGYTQVGDGSDFGDRLQTLSDSYDASVTDDERRMAEIRLGEFLLAGSRINSKSSVTKKVVAWLGKDGRVLVTTGFDYSRLSKKDAKRNPNGMYKFTVGKADKSAAKKGEEIASGKVGVSTMLANGYRPIASMSMLTARGPVAFSVPSIQEYNQFIGKPASDEQASVRSAISEFDQSGVVDNATQADEAGGSEILDQHQAKDEVGKVSPDEGGEDVETGSDALSWLAGNLDVLKQMDEYWNQNKGHNADKVVSKFMPTVVARIEESGIPIDVAAGMALQIESVLIQYSNADVRERFQREQAKIQEQAPEGLGESSGVSSDGSQPGNDASNSNGNLGVDPQSSESGTAQAEAGEAPAGGGPAESRAPASGSVISSAGVQSLDELKHRYVSEIYRLGQLGAISDADASQAIEDVMESEDDVEAQFNYLAAITEAKGFEDSQKDKLDDDDIQVNLNGESFRLVPDSEYAIRNNLGRLRSAPIAPVTTSGITGAISDEQIRADYPTLTDALKRIGNMEQAGIVPTLGSSPLSALALSMQSNASLTGAQLVFINDPSVTALVRLPSGESAPAPFAGKYDMAKDQVVINLAYIRDLNDLHSTILHEVVHAYIDRMDLRFDLDPASLSESDKAAISAIRGLADIAKQNGIEWQGSASTDQRTSYREFYALALTDQKFQAQLASIRNPMPYSKVGSNLWEQFKDFLSKLLSSAVKMFGGLGVKGEGPVYDDSILSAVTDAANYIIRSRNEQTSFLDSRVGQLLAKRSPIQSRQTISYRIVEDMFGSGTDISVDKNNQEIARTEAKLMMATTNHVAASFEKMLNAWRAANPGIQFTTRSFVEDFIGRMFKGGVYAPEEIRAAINKALADQGANSVDQNTSLADIEQKGQLPKAAKDAFEILKRFEAELYSQVKKADHAFGKRAIVQRIQESNQDLMDLKKGYTDITVIQKEFLKAVRVAVKEENAGTYGVVSVGKALGVNESQVKTALTDVQANISAYTDALDAMASLGLDFTQMKRGGTLTVAQVDAEVQASADPNLSSVKADKAKLAVLINFARRKPIVMDLLTVRRSPVERSAVNSIIDMAMQDKANAFDEAVTQMRKLIVLGKVGERILSELNEHKKRHRQLLDTADRYAKILEMHKVAAPVLQSEIRKIERILRLESSAGQSSQWNAVHGAEYYVPKDQTMSEADLFGDKGNKRTLQLGEHFDSKQVNSDVMAMKSWLASHQHLQGTANYELIAKQVDKLTRLYAESANYQIQRGPGGLIIQVFGDIATQAEWTGTHAGRVFSQQVRRFNTLYDAHLKGPEQREFWTFDRMKREAMEATGLSAHEFDRRIYNQALNFLEHHKELINKSLTEEQQLDASVKEAVRHLESVDQSMDLKDAPRVVAEFLKQAVRCNNITQKNRAAMGLKVREKILGRYIFREPIGNPAHTMSRGIGWDIRSFVRSKMATPVAWESEVADGSNKMTAPAIAELYRNNKQQLATVTSSRFSPEVVEKFVRPLVFKTGASNFSGPSASGIVDRAQPDNVINALNMSGGDMVKFAEVLFDLEGGSGDVADFVGQTMATFQKYYSILRDVSNSLPDSREGLEDSVVVARSFLDAREGEDFPHEWLDYRQFGHVDNVRYTRMFALQAAYGEDGKGAGSNIDKMIAELTDLEAQYNAAMMENDPAIRNAKLNEGGLKRARMDARKNKVLAVRLKDNFRNLISTMNGVPFEETIFNKMTGMLAGYTVQGAATAFTDTVSMMETVFRKFGFSKEALSFIFGNYKNFGMETLGSLFQAIGMQLNFNSEWEQQTRLINMGLIDQDALTDRRLFGAVAEKYKELLGDDDSLSAVLRKTSGDKLMRVKGIAHYAATRVSAGLRVGLDTGIGVAKNPELSYPTVKIHAPFTWVNQLMHRAVARQWLNITMETVRRATEYMRAHPGAAIDPSFRFDPTKLQFSGRGLAGLKLDDVHFSYVNETLQRNGISLEEAARRGVSGEPALTEEQIHAIVSLAQTEILLNSSVATRPAWSINSPAGRLSSPIIGWSLYKMVDLVKTTRTPQGRAELKAFKQATLAMLLGVIPASLAYALLRDWWDEEVLDKKSNTVPLALDKNLVPSLIDNLSRVGTFGIGGDFVNSVINVSTSREFSLDSRIFFINSMLNLKNIVSTIYNQDGTVTYDTVARPLFQSLGGSGYLANFDAINNLLSFDNSERRVIRRINVNNQLRSIGREMKLDVRTGRGMTAIPNPVKPWVSQMVLAAYANDPGTFRDAYIKAVEAATRENLKNPVPGADPKADVAEAYKRMHPLRMVFQKAPTQQEYQKILVQLGKDSEEVAAAIRNFNSYGAQIPSGRGKEGIAPFTGTAREQKGRTQSLITSDFGSGDFRSLTTRF